MTSCESRIFEQAAHQQHIFVLLLARILFLSAPIRRPGHNESSRRWTIAFVCQRINCPGLLEDATEAKQHGGDDMSPPLTPVRIEFLEKIKPLCFMLNIWDKR